MAFCPSCGAEAQGNFCPKCGAATNTAATGETGGYVPPVQTSAGISENVASALCYLLGLVTGIIFLVIPPYNQNKTVRFHAFQAIFLHVALIIAVIGLNIVLGMLHAVVGFGFFFLSPLIFLGAFLLWLYMMWSAYNNKKVVLPVIGELAEKQA